MDWSDMLADYDGSEIKLFDLKTLDFLCVLLNCSFSLFLFP